VIDWEYGNVRSNPYIQEQEDLKIKAAMAENKGYNIEGTSEIIADS
jgi:hypothetical protein